MRRYVLKEDVTIPAGTILCEAATKTERFTPHVCHDLGHTNDVTSNWCMDLEEGLALGLIVEATSDRD